MRARDIMTREVVSVPPDMPARQVARLLLEHGISAVPVIDDSGAPIGMVSEGDLIGRDQADREARRDWWLELLAEGDAINPHFLASLRAPERKARDVMTGPVVTADEETGLDEIARLLTRYHVKRVPVLREGRVVGIVSRADLLRALAEERAAPQQPVSAGHSLLAEALMSLDERFLHTRPAAPPSPARRAAEPPGISAADFDALMAGHARQERQHRDEQRRAESEARRRAVASLIDEHVSDAGWRGLLHGAREAAEKGQKEFMLLRFPSQLCSDGGRAINVSDPAWPASLRGEAAELYLRWERELKPRGFRLAARLLDFPGGKPGDVGLFLQWGH